MLKTRTIQENNTLLVATTALLIIGFAYALTASASSKLDNSLRAKGGLKGPYLEIHWPERPIHKGTQPAITLRIPKEYLHEGTTWLDEKGKIKSVAILFELPGPMPWQERPWLKGKKGTPEYEEFMKTWLGKFSMDVKPEGRGYESRMWYRPADCAEKRKQGKIHGSCLDRYMRDADIAGLERYSTKRCYTPEHLMNPPMKKYLDEKPADDPSPSNCRLDRLWTVVVSPPEITNDEEGVAIECMSAGCWAHFSISAVSMSMAINHKDIPRWKEIVEPARGLVRSFIVQNQKPAGFRLKQVTPTRIGTPKRKNKWPST